MEAVRIFDPKERPTKVLVLDLDGTDAEVRFLSLHRQNATHSVERVAPRSEVAAHLVWPDDLGVNAAILVTWEAPRVERCALPDTVGVA